MLNFIFILLVSSLFILFVINFTAASYTLYYFRHLYPKTIRPRFKTGYFPRCSVIIPAKGISDNLKNNFYSFLKQDYPDFEIIYTTESKDDPAYLFLKNHARGHANVKVIHANLTTACCQKNENILAALKHTTNPEIYIFADSDVSVGANWLRELTLPLSDPNITAATSYLWPNTQTSNIKEYTHIFMNLYTLSLFCLTSSFFHSPLMWGGSMAISKKNFEKLNIADFWSKAIVDDTSLSKILSDHNNYTIFVPTALSQSRSPIQNIFDSINWYTRQLMYLKIYRKGLWYIITGTMFWMNTFLYSFALLGFIIFVRNPSNPLAALALISLIHFILEIYNTYLLTQLGPIKSPYKMFFFSPIFRLSQLFAYAKTFFKKTIYWSGAYYQINSHGQVTNVTRKKIS